MTGSVTGVQFKPSVRRWAAPVVAAWLLHAGVWWLVVLVLAPLAMSALTASVNWLIQHFSLSSWPMEHSFSLPRLLAEQFAESLVAIFGGLAVGWWTLRRRSMIEKSLIEKSRIPK